MFAPTRALAVRRAVRTFRHRWLLAAGLALVSAGPVRRRARRRSPDPTPPIPMSACRLRPIVRRIPASGPRRPMRSRPRGRAELVARPPPAAKPSSTRNAASASHCQRCRQGPAVALSIALRQALRMVFAGWRHGRGGGRCWVGARQGRRRGALAGGGRDRPRCGGASHAQDADGRAAVQLALLNNGGLQAAYNELGMAEAALVQGVAAAKSDILARPHRRRRRGEIERQVGRRYPGAGDPAVPRRDRPRSISPGAAAAPPSRRCDSPPRPARLLPHRCRQ